jgi:hypothetical protein
MPDNNDKHDLDYDNFDHRARYHIDYNYYGDPHNHHRRAFDYAAFVDLDNGHGYDSACNDDDCPRTHVYVLTDDQYRAVNLYIDLAHDGAVPIDDPRADPAAFLAVHGTINVGDISDLPGLEWPDDPGR